tara:strand:- start:355 stop:1125 length:771 start_codon:yes stop_codon:yes gene_type:complete
MKRIIILIMIATVLISCRKTSKMEVTEGNLMVEESNMAVLAKRTATWCSPCGSSGFPLFENLKTQYGDDAVYMAWKDAFVTSTGSTLFDEVGPQFNLGGTVPTFFANFQKDWSDSMVRAHINAEYVIANSNYDMIIGGDRITLRTTTKFFTDVEGHFILAPYLIVDNIVGYQNGHPDDNNTTHRNYVVNIATPTTNVLTKNFGYQITTKGADRGFTVNLEFEVDRNPLWPARNISFALIIFKRQPWGLEFINAFTK